MHAEQALFPTGGSETERATAYSDNLSYFGTYDVDVDDVIHTIIGSAYPNWSDTVQRRAFEIDGDTLVLKAQPDSDDPKQAINARIWRRN